MNHRSLPLILLGTSLLLTACPPGDVNPNNPTPPSSGITCGDGTKLEGGQCLPRDEYGICEEGTMNVDGVCVRVLDGVCAEGTSFEAEMSRCVPDVVCGPGTNAVDGQCLAKTELMNQDSIPEEDGENDPAFGGSPQELTLEPVGDSLLVAGAFDVPLDKNMDRVEDQDVDVYSFTASAGDYLDIKVLQTGVGSFGFEVRGPQGFVRQAPRYLAEPGRKLYIPADGTYQIGRAHV